MRLGGALRVTVCCAQASQTASSPTLMQGGLRARWSPAAIGWGVRLTDCLRGGGSAGSCAGRAQHMCHIADTHNCNIPGAMRSARAGIFLRGHASRPRRGCPHIPGPCVTPAQECNAHTGDALMRAGDGTGGNRRPRRRGSHFGAYIRLPGATTPSPATFTHRGQLRPRRRRSDTGGNYARTGTAAGPFVTSMRGKMQG